jgi:hypothetical protein
MLTAWQRDTAAIVLLIALCALYFWRLLTPNPANQLSLVTGDFSGQFVAFAQYQAERYADGQIPLWNPYQLGSSRIRKRQYSTRRD